MQKLIIDGKKTLSGSINISGSKNSALPILAATILNNHTTIKNIPYVNDIMTMLNLLKLLTLKFQRSLVLISIKKLLWTKGLRKHLMNLYR